MAKRSGDERHVFVMNKKQVYNYDSESEDEFENNVATTDGVGFSKCASGNKERSLKYTSSRYKGRRPDENRERNTQFQVQSETFYKVSEYFPRGKLVIFNQKYFKPVSGLQNYPRIGTDIDVNRLTALFLELGFIVDCFNNLTREEVLREMRILAKLSFQNLGSLFVCILTHGVDDQVYASDAPIKVKDIFKQFATQKLFGKPKVFFIEACRGSVDMEGYDATDGRGDYETDSHGSIDSKKLSLPTESDFLYCYSTAEGFKAWLNDKQGSWFIQAICDVFREHAHNKDIVQMMTLVNGQLAERRTNTNDLETSNKRQVASSVIQLRKDFYFFPPFPLQGSIEWYEQFEI